MLSSVILYFTSNLGEIEVEVLNTTTGGWVVNNGGTYDYDYNKTMIYGFSLN